MSKPMTTAPFNKNCPMPKLLALTVSVLVAVQAAPAAAQDTTAAPTYGSVALSSGFSPDPHVVDIVVGGEINAADTSSDCLGYVASAPDFSLNYTEEQYSLSILAVSATDTTLLVNDPEGAWFCNDDTGDLDNNNPGIYFGSPKSGRYDIWIGSYSTDNNYQSAQLVITEQGTENWRTIAANLASATTPQAVPSSTPAQTPQVIPQQPQVAVPTAVPTTMPTEGVIQYDRKSN